MILKRVCSSVAAVTLMFTGVTFASDDISVKYNNSGKFMEIEGSVGTVANELVSVSVYEDTESIDFSNPVLFSSVYTGDEGRVDFDLKTSSAFQSGRYVIYLSSGDAKAQGVLNYVSEEGLLRVMNLINEQTDPEKVSDIIKSSKRDLGLDETESDRVIDRLAEILVANRDSDYTDTDSFYEEFTLCLATAYLNEKDNTADILKKYESEFSISTEELGKLDSRTLNKLYDVMKTADYTKGYPSEQLADLIFIADILKSETWSELKYAVLGLDESGKKINNNFEILNPDTGYYDKVKGINNVYREMFDEISEVKTLDDLRTLFERCARDVYDDEKDAGKNNGGSSGSGGSGGSGSGGKVSLTPYVPVEIVTPDEPVEDALFYDISSHWARADIEALATNGVISGYPDGSFMPDKSVTRAEFVKLITLAFDLPEVQSASDFEDVASDAWYKLYVDSAVGAGLIKGTSQTSFSPEASLSREDAALILYRYLNTFETLEISDISFTDDNMISDYAKDGVYALCGVGIINGMEDGSFAPKAELTRAQACKLLNSIDAYLASQDK